MQRGTIVLTRFPFTDLSSAKKRPAVVVSNRLSDKNDIIVAFISSVIPTDKTDTDYLITEKHSDFGISGLKTSSVVKLDKIATINMSIIAGEIGSLSGSAMKDISDCLKVALGL